ncbi:sugar transferase [Clostridium algidicarnis]|uniref:sugar transferase n=1 Tax=Clostridium algidicarnis TaxID=37659 RepID=UPI001C0DA105|nr:sugar transferase [Clostridium algidicarnis]MBU3194445.1 sugar transferase [Clostridium algidicarnis]
MYHYIKRIIDFTMALIGLIILSPLFMLLALIIKLDSKGPVFFKQKRVAKDKLYFNILKFRTMRVDTPKDMPTHMLNNPDAFITRLGRLLRKTSLDELPQIINILKGEMSIVGPRPCLWNQYDLIAERDKYGANNIYPGLTGWAQVNGRDELPIEVKAKLDGEYVKRRSFAFDVKIFFKTIFRVIKSDGVKEGGMGSVKIKEVEVREKVK